MKYSLKDVWKARKEKLPLFVRLYTDPATLVLAYLVVNFSDLTPNTITFINHILSLIGGIIFMTDWKLGIFLLWFAFQLDGVDGIVARLKNQRTKIGEYMEEYLHIGALSSVFIGMTFYKTFKTPLPLLILCLSLWSKIFLYTSFNIVSHLNEKIKLYQGRIASRLPKINWFGKKAYVTYKGLLSLLFYLSPLLNSFELAYWSWILSLIEGIIENTIKGIIFLRKIAKISLSHFPRFL